MSPFVQLTPLTIAGHFRIWVVKHSSQTNRPFAQQRSAAGCWTVSLLTATMDMQLHADFHNSGMRSSKAIDEHLNPRQSLSLLTSCTPTFTIRECGMTSLAYDRSKASILLASHPFIFFSFICIHGLKSVVHMPAPKQPSTMHANYWTLLSLTIEAEADSLASLGSLAACTVGQD